MLTANSKFHMLPFGSCLWYWLMLLVLATIYQVIHTLQQKQLHFLILYKPTLSAKVPYTPPVSF